MWVYVELNFCLCTLYFYLTSSFCFISFWFVQVLFSFIFFIQNPISKTKANFCIQPNKHNQLHIQLEKNKSKHASPTNCKTRNKASPKKGGKKINPHNHHHYHHHLPSDSLPLTHQPPFATHTPPPESSPRAPYSKS